MSQLSRELHDQFTGIATTLSHYFAFAADASAFYTEQAKLEREHATALRALIRKTQERRAKRVLSIIGGDSPSTQIRDGDEHTRQHTLMGAWTRLLATSDEAAQSKLELANQLDSTASEIRASEAKNTALLKQHATFYDDKLLGHQDDLANHRNKSKEKYDAACSTLEHARQKQDSSKDADKAAKAYSKAEEEMRIAKNTYCLSLETVNAHKATFFQRDIPEVQDHLAQVWRVFTTRLNELLASSTQQHSTHYDNLKNQQDRLLPIIQAIDPITDQSIYIQLNKRTFYAPADSKFEACGLWHDDDRMIDQGDAKQYLQNLLSSKERELSDQTLLASRTVDVGKASDLLDAYIQNTGLGDPSDVARDLFEHYRALYPLRAEVEDATVQFDVISDVLGDDTGDIKPHSFKSSAFAIPTACAVCQQNIFGFGKPGSKCQACGISVHTKCGLVISSSCGAKSAGAAGRKPSRRSRLGSSFGTHRSSSSSQAAKPAGEKVERGTGGARRSSMDLTRRSTGASTSSRQSWHSGAPPPIASPALPSSGEQRQKVMFTYESSGDGDITVLAGDEVVILEPDSGGWSKVRSTAGEEGIVPSSYLGEPKSSATSSRIAVVSVAYQASGGPDELTVDVGEEVQLLSDGGGEGWQTIINAAGERGVVPVWAVS